MSETAERLRALPAADRLLNDPEGAALAGFYGYDAALSAGHTIPDDARPNNRI